MAAPCQRSLFSLSHLHAGFPPLVCSADAGGHLHSVGHDSRDQAELDRGSEEEHPAEQLSRPHTVIHSFTHLQLFFFSKGQSQDLCVFSVAVI